MNSPPYKNKEIKTLPRLKPYERWNILKKFGFNTSHIPSDYVTFDLMARGMSSWSHFQKAAYMVGDEAYAGSRNYIRLQEAVEKVLGIHRIVPTHNGIGSEKLMATTILQPSEIVLGNSGYDNGLVSENGGIYKDITGKGAKAYRSPDVFGADVDLTLLKDMLQTHPNQKIAYIHLKTCPEGWNGQPVSLANIDAVSQLAQSHKIPLALDISCILENVHWIIKRERKKDTDPIDLARKIINLADIVLMDASQDCRSDVGGFITSKQDEVFERFRNQVLVYEGLHTYGGMTGRAMEVFAEGLEELQQPEFVSWYTDQVSYLYHLLKHNGVPAYLGTCGVALDVKSFLPHLFEDDFPKFVIAASLYIYGGIRSRIDGFWVYHTTGQGRRVLNLELPRHAYSRSHLERIADSISTAYKSRDDIMGMQLVNKPEFVDEAVFEPKKQRLFVAFPKVEEDTQLFEPYKIAIFEPIKLWDQEYRKAAIEKAGFNTFLLDSKDVYIDFLTDSGTSAMSSYQWEGMTNSTDTPVSSRHYRDLVEEFGKVLGFEHIIPTHQGRAAEHIMSQIMIESGQSVPGNMYFTTTKLHQEMAGGVFVDVIVDEAYDTQSDFPWKGNIDLKKLKRQIDIKGAENIAYISFELAVNMAGGQPISMDNARQVSRLCQKHGIPIMYDATRCVENAQMIKKKDPSYVNKNVKDILRELMSYGDGCAISCKKDFMVNMGGLLACNNTELAYRFKRMLRIWEGSVTTGGLDPKDLEALRRGLLDSLDDDYIAMRVEQTQRFGNKLKDAGVPIVNPPGSHAIFIDARRFLPHLDQDEYPAQALCAAIYQYTGVRSMERGNVSKGRNPVTGENYRPDLELVRLTIPRRVYTNDHFDFVIEGIAKLYKDRDKVKGLEFVYEPKVLRFFQSRFVEKQS